MRPLLQSAFILLLTMGAAAQTGSRAREFVGSTPADESVIRALGLPQDAGIELLEWKLELDPDAQTYRLGVAYGTTVPNQPGLGPDPRSIDRRGSFRVKQNKREDAAVYELAGSVSLARISEHLMHVLAPDGSLMSGNGGWSYTLNGRTVAEAALDPRADIASGSARRLSPLAAGPVVYEVFDGRSPCQGIARQLGIAVGPGCAKVKWRLVLYRDPATGAPTTYQLESTLHRSAARVGAWSVSKGPPAVIVLAPTGPEKAVRLLRGDKNVLFFVDADWNPLVGNSYFSYTLDRRRPPATN
jgi:hypothetical protein